MSYKKTAVRGSRGNVSPKGSKDGSFVPSHQDGQALSCSYLHQLEEAIKTRTPIAGAGITITRTDAGSTISFKSTEEKILNVCSNGVPDTITVLALVKN